MPAVAAIKSASPSIGAARVGEETVGERLRLARTRKGMTRKDAADRLRRNPDTITRWETGRTSPTVDELRALSEVYCVDPAWLLEGATSSRASLIDTVTESASKRVDSELVGKYLIDMRAVRAIMEARRFRDIAHLVRDLGGSFVVADISMAVHQGCRVAENDEAAEIDRLIRHKLDSLARGE